MRQDTQDTRQALDGLVDGPCLPGPRCRPGAPRQRGWMGRWPLPLTDTIPDTLQGGTVSPWNPHIWVTCRNPHLGSSAGTPKQVCGMEAGRLAGAGIPCGLLSALAREPSSSQASSRSQCHFVVPHCSPFVGKARWKTALFVNTRILFKTSRSVSLREGETGRAPSV